MAYFLLWNYYPLKYPRLWLQIVQGLGGEEWEGGGRRGRASQCFCISLNTRSVTLWPAELLFLSYCFLFVCLLAQQCNSWISNTEFFGGGFVYKAGSSELLCSCLLQWKYLYCVYFRVFSRIGLFPFSLPSTFWDFCAHVYIHMPFVLSVKSMQKLPLLLDYPENASRVPKSSNLEVQA